MTKAKDRIVWSSEQGDLRKKDISVREVISLPARQQTI
jgi:hypothetical protein